MQLNKDILTKGQNILISEAFKDKIKVILKEEDESQYDGRFELFKDEDIDFDVNLVQEFVEFCLKYLNIDRKTGLKVVLSSEKEKFTTYAFYDIQSHIAAVYCVGRAVLDCFRSLAHELVHHKQNINNEIPKEETSSENDGSVIENEANSIAGVIMRLYGRAHPELY